MDHGEVPVGIAQLDASDLPVSAGDLEAAAFDHDGAVVPALGAAVAACEGKAQRGSVRARRVTSGPARNRATGASPISAWRLRLY